MKIPKSSFILIILFCLIGNNSTLLGSHKSCKQHTHPSPSSLDSAKAMLRANANNLTTGFVQQLGMLFAYQFFNRFFSSSSESVPNLDHQERILERKREEIKSLTTRRDSLSRQLKQDDLTPTQAEELSTQITQANEVLKAKGADLEKLDIIYTAAAFQLNGTSKNALTSTATPPKINNNPLPLTTHVHSASCGHKH